MEYLFTAWDKVVPVLRSKPLYLFFDYDGTLADLADTPDKAFMSEAVRGILEKLALDGKIPTAIISGRSLTSLKKVINIPGLIYVGNHGLEVEGKGLYFNNGLNADIRFAVERIGLILDRELKGVSGVLLEDKGLSVSIHYRHVAGPDIDNVRRIVDRVMINFPDRSFLALHHGKMVFEIRPISKFNKGSVVLWLLEQKNKYWRDMITPVYVGDDITDEDAFMVLRGSGVTIRVGKNDDSAAQYYLNHSEDVSTFLSQLLALR